MCDTMTTGDSPGSVESVNGPTPSDSGNAKRHYSRTLPDQPGWYWFLPEHSNTPKMTYVRKGLQFANVQTIMGDHERSHTSISVSDQQYLLDMKGLWSAKLEAPEP